MSFAKPLGHENGKRVTDDFVRRISEHSRCCPVEVNHVPSAVGGNDGIVGGLCKVAKPLLAGCQRVFNPLALADVAGYLRKTPQTTFPVQKRGDDHVRPELRTALAHPPAFVLDPALADRSAKLLLRFAVANVFFGIETRKVPADDLLRPIAFDPFRSEIPTGD